MLDSELILPHRSAEGMAALDIFYLGFNDVNFYVEDVDQENLYEAILKKWLPNVHFSRIFPLGGKCAVLKHANNDANASLPTRSLYIVDKDFDDLLGKIVEDERIFFLERYCIENHIIDCNSVIDVVIETHPKHKAAEIHGNLNIEEFIQDSLSALAPLFQLFYCVQALNLGIENCNCKVEEFSKKNQPWIIDMDKVGAYRNLLERELITEDLKEKLAELLESTRAIFLDKGKLHLVVSGKMLISMAFHYVKSKYKFGAISLDSFVFRLAKNSRMQSFEPIAGQMKRFLSEH